MFSAIATLTYAPVCFYIEGIRPFVWNDEAYEYLVYPQEQKDLVLTIIGNHQRSKREGFIDVVDGKVMISEFTIAL